MPETTITNRKFAQEPAHGQEGRKQAARRHHGSGRPAHVLLSYEEYRRLKRGEPSLANLLFHPEGQDIDFDPPKLNLILKPVNLD